MIIGNSNYHHIHHHYYYASELWQYWSTIFQQAISQLRILKPVYSLLTKLKFYFPGTLSTFPSLFFLLSTPGSTIKARLIISTVYRVTFILTGLVLSVRTVWYLCCAVAKCREQLPRFVGYWMFNPNTPYLSFFFNLRILSF